MLNKVSRFSYLKVFHCFIIYSPFSLSPPHLQDNKTVLDVAVEHEQLEVIELLVGREAMIGEGMPEMVGSLLKVLCSF